MLVLNAGPEVQKICNMPLIGESLPALHVAAKLGHEIVVQHLLTICAINEQDADGQTDYTMRQRREMPPLYDFFYTLKGWIHLFDPRTITTRFGSLFSKDIWTYKILLSKFGREARLDDDVYIEAARLENAAILRELLSRRAPHAQYFRQV
jgi:hypothetical protein